MKIKTDWFCIYVCRYWMRFNLRASQTKSTRLSIYVCKYLIIYYDSLFCSKNLIFMVCLDTAYFAETEK